MSATEAAVQPDASATDAGSVAHLYCTCSPDRAVCGSPLDGIDDGIKDWAVDPDTCVVCLDLESAHLHRGGES